MLSGEGITVGPTSAEVGSGLERLASLGTDGELDDVEKRSYSL
jgi:hypothetical protein